LSAHETISTGSPGQAQALGRRALVSLDVMQLDPLAGLVDATVAGLDVVVNNSGGSNAKPFCNRRSKFEWCLLQRLDRVR
jgi:hypothetical protein